VRLTQRIDEDERRSILLALPTLKTDQRDLEARMAAVSADTTTFDLPSEEVFDSLKAAADALGTETTRIASASTFVATATALVAAVRAVVPEA